MYDFWVVDGIRASWICYDLIFPRYIDVLDK